MCSSAFADNECAQALLELAESSPVNGVMKAIVQSFSDAPHSTSAPCLNESADHGIKKIADGKSSILKRQLEETECRKAPSKTLSNFDPNLCVKMDCRSKEELRKELTKRICLDHNYTQLNQSVLKGRRSWPEPKQSTIKSPTRGLHSWKSTESPRSNPFHSDPVAVSGDTSTGSPLLQEQRVPKAKSEKENLATGSQQDLYQPEDSNYKNFNLLLKCLKADASTDRSRSSHKKNDDIDKRPTDHQSASYDEECTNQLMNASNTDSAEYQCLFCPRVFQQKCYMMKHMRHMHATSLKEEQDKKTDDVICPSCGMTVLWKDFKQHSHVCNQHTKKSKKQLEMNLAKCQFCGIRMRRHSLVLHLAQVHWRDNLDRTNSVFFDEDVDSDSSTLSGSEHELEDELDEATKHTIQLSNVDAVPSKSLTGVQRLDFPASVESDRRRSHDFIEVLPAHGKESAPAVCDPDSQSVLQRFLSDASGKLDCNNSDISTLGGDCHSCIEHMMLHGENANSTELCLGSSNNNCPVASQMDATGLPSASFSVCLSKENSIQNFMPAPSVLVAPSLRTKMVSNT